MNIPAHDGRITLCPNTLKTLRRERGISQEKMAFLCAEKGLCVSVASLKRAETSKNVLYRTARDISRFYEVDVSNLIDVEETTDLDIVNPPAENASSITTQRHFILFSCHVDTIHRSTNTKAELLSALSHIATQYDANFYESDSDNIHYAFGIEHTHGNEIKRAIFFGFRCLQLIKAVLSQQTRITIGIDWAKATTTLTDCSKQNCDTSIDEHYLKTIQQLIDDAPADTICVSDRLKTTLDDSFSCSSIDTNTQPIWQIDLVESSNEPKEYEKLSRPLVGRKVEIIQFNAVLESTTEYRTAHIIHLMGQAGIGKSRLLDEACRMAQLENFSTHVISIPDFHVEQYEQAIPSLMRSLLNIKTHQKPLSIEEMIATSKLSWLNETKHLPLLYSLLGWPLSKAWVSLLDAMTPERLHHAQCQVIAQIIQTRAKEKQLLIAIEDYHWADKSLRDYIHSIICQCENHPVIFLITSRPSNAASLLNSQHEASNLDVTQISLSPLSKKDAQHLANYFLDIDKTYQKKCIEKAQGNPLFLEQLFNDSNSANKGEFPPSLHALVLARIDSMPLQEQLAVRAASVIGQKFSLPLLRSLLCDENYNPSALIHANIINGVDTDYMFNHALIMEGVYLSITLDDRNKLHTACSEWYTKDDILQCHHLLKANHPGALNKLVIAAQLLINRYQFEEAKALIATGISMKKNHLTACRLFELNAEVYVRLGDTELALDAFQKMQENAQQPEEKVKALIGLANCLNTLDHFDEAQAALNTGHDIASENNFIPLLSRIFYLNGNFLFPKGKVEQCFELQEKALYFAKKSGNPELEARALGGLGDAAYAQGKMVSAYQYFRQCLDLSEEHRLQQVAAANLFMLGTVSIYHNESEKALSFVEQSIATAELVGHKRAEVVSRLTASWILLDWLRLDEAIVHIDTGLALADEIGAKRFIPFLLESKARYYAFCKKNPEAVNTIDQAIEQINALNIHAFIGPWVMSTRALLSEDWQTANTWLTSGEASLAQGCVGHNYYRFYVNAIDTCLKHQQFEKMQAYIDQLTQYTRDEETPWSGFYIRRGQLLINRQTKPESSIDALVQTAQAAKLLSALDVFENM